MTFDVGTFLNIVTTLAVVVGVGFGLSEVRNDFRNRRDLAAAEIVRTVQTPEVIRAVERVMKLADDIDPDAIARDPDLRDAALAVYSACEMWGSMVFEGVVDPHMLDRMVGGWVRGTWSRLHRWVDAERTSKRSQNVGEWWQWLYELLIADPDPGKAQGAHLAYRGKRRR